MRPRGSWLAAALLLTIGGCDATESTVDGDSRPPPDTAPDTAAPDASQPAADVAVDAGVPIDMAVDQVPAPDQARLIIEQLDLKNVTGESALVVGPDGTSVLIDTGNDAHAAAILAALKRRLGAHTVDWVISTHYHNDHFGAFDKLFGGSQPVPVTHGVVSRGRYDLDGAYMQTDVDYQQYCQELVQSPKWDGKRFDLCSGSQEAPCDGVGSGDPWPASGCPGLLLGDLSDPGDDTQGNLSYIALGGGARLVLFHANGYVATTAGIESAEASGVTIGHGSTYSENTRSVGGVIRWGSFSYSFHGDTPGGMKPAAPDMEGFLAARAAKITEGPQQPALLPTGALDVVHVNHHGYGDVFSQAWLDWLMPADGKSRNAVIGTNLACIFAPDAEVLKRLGTRVQGGYIWDTEPGTWSGTHPLMKVAAGAVVVEVTDGGASYEVHALTAAGKQQVESFSSTSP